LSQFPGPMSGFGSSDEESFVAEDGVFYASYLL
jgi:hypothetical protein